MCRANESESAHTHTHTRGSGSRWGPGGRGGALRRSEGAVTLERKSSWRAVGSHVRSFMPHGPFYCACGFLDRIRVILLLTFG